MGTSFFSKRFGSRFVLSGFFSLVLLFSFQNCGTQFQVNTETSDLSSLSSVQTPSVTFESTTPTLINTPTYTLPFRVANVQDSEVRSITCQFNQQPVVDCSSRSLVLNQLVDGEHRVRIVVETVSGMIGETVRIFRKDSTAPVLTVAMAPLAVNNQTSASILVNATDNLSGVERFECAFNSEVYSLCTMPVNLTNLVAGNQNLKVRAYDRINNLSLVSEIIWTVNLTIPVVTISSSPAALTNQTTASLVFSGPTVVTYECSLDNAAFAACVSPVNLSNLTAGAHNFRVRGTSAAGNISMPAVANWSIELAAPTLAFSQMPSTLTNQTSATFAFSSPGSVTFECQLDTAAYAACTSPRTVTGLSAGAHVFRVRARSAAGNLSTPIMHSWSVDLAAPTVNLTSMPSVNTNQTSANFAFSGTGIVNYECQLDSAAYTSCTSPRVLSGLSVGAHTFRVRGTNAAGNVSAPVQFVWNVELQASAIAFTQQPQPVIGASSATFAFSGNNIASYECQLDSAAYAACTSPRVLSGLVAGAHVFRVRGVSLAGNISQAVSYNWTVELAPPAVNIISGPSNPTNQSTAVFNFSGTDAVRFECQLNGAAFSTCTSPHTIANLVAGNYNLNIRAINNTGLVSTNRSYDWSVDLTRPTVRMTSAPRNSTRDVNVQVAFVGEDAGGINRYECSLNNSQFAACTSPLLYSNLRDANYTFQVRAIDNAGNFSFVNGATWYVDTTPPTFDRFTFYASANTFSVITNTNSNDTLSYSLDGAAFVRHSNNIEVTTSYGPHSVRFQLIDSAGNMALSSAFNFNSTQAVQISRAATPYFSEAEISPRQIGYHNGYLHKFGVGYGPNTSGKFYLQTSNLMGVVTQTTELNWSASDLVIRGNYAYLAGDRCTIHVMSLENPAAPVFVRSVSAPQGCTLSGTFWIYRLHIRDGSNDLVYIGPGQGEEDYLTLFSINNPSTPTFVMHGRGDIDEMTTQMNSDLIYSSGVLRRFVNLSASETLFTASPIFRVTTNLYNRELYINERGRISVFSGATSNYSFQDNNSFLSGIHPNASLSVYGNYLVSSWGSLSVYDISDRSRIRLVATISETGTAQNHFTRVLNFDVATKTLVIIESRSQTGIEGFIQTVVLP